MARKREEGWEEKEIEGGKGKKWGGDERRKGVEKEN